VSLILGVGHCYPELVPLGLVRKNGNHVALTFAEGALARFETELRPFLFLGSASLRTWPADITAEMLGAKIEAKIWANPLGKKKDRRPVVWCGWPTEWGALLRPAVEAEQLGGYELKQDGFLRTL
jgi:hypothetical protein